jgi:predicted amidohydrolase YtcJ
MAESLHPDLVLFHGRFTTLDRARPTATAVAILEGRFQAVGSDAEVLALAGPSTRRIDLQGQAVLPGLIDNHLHIIRGGLSFNLELRWDGVPSLADAMALLRAQVAITPAPQWVRVVGGFSEHQFAEKRLPTLDELNAAAPDTPVFILHLYDRALLNGAALRAVGYDRHTPSPPGGEIVRDRAGNPTGLLLARPNAALLYATLARGPRLPIEYQLNSTRHFMRELNRLGVTGAIDAGGGFQNYPEDYQVVQQLADAGLLTVRLAYNLFTQKSGQEKQDFLNWTSSVTYKQGDAYFRHNGAGEMLVFSAADFEDFREPRPELPSAMEPELEEVVRILAQNHWPWRLHATYDETISRALDVFEKVHRDTPIDGLHWFFDHAETVSERSMDRIAALGGGVAVQHRMAYQGEDFVARYGARAAEATPPVARLLDKGIRTSAGTDGTRVASYNPWVSLAWLVTGQTVGGLQITPQRHCLSRDAALRMWTEQVTWFSNEEGLKGRIEVGQLADLVVPDRDFFACAESDIAGTSALLTLVGGKVVWATGPFKALDEAPPPPAMPDWSPVRRLGGLGHGAAHGAIGKHGKHGTHGADGADGAPLQASLRQATAACACAMACQLHGHGHARAWAADIPVDDLKGFWGALGCACWAV